MASGSLYDKRINEKDDKEDLPTIFIVPRKYYRERIKVLQNY